MTIAWRGEFVDVPGDPCTLTNLRHLTRYRANQRDVSSAGDRLVRKTVLTNTADALQRRLSYLRNWELGNVALLPAEAAVIWVTSGDLSVTWHLRALSMFFVSYLFLQGGIYWHLKLECVRRHAVGVPAWFVPAFTWLRRTNLGVIGGAAVCVFVGRHGSGAADRAWSIAIVAFAAVENVNYYVRQLMHDTDAHVAYLRRFRRLRHPPLRRDLDRARSP